MPVDRTTRSLSLAALVVSLVALVFAARSFMVEQDHARQVEALGDLIQRSAAIGRPVMDMGPPGGGRPELDRGD